MSNLFATTLLLQLPSRVLEVELTTSSSNYHVEMNPSDVGNNDRYVVQEIIKVACASKLWQIETERSNNSTRCTFHELV